MRHNRLYPNGSRWQDSRCIRAALDDALVPMSRDSVKMTRQREDLFIQVSLRDSGANESTTLDFAKESYRFTLSVSKLFDPKAPAFVMLSKVA
jgi:hypothetical protein